jgi:Ketopantoate hydroxymethyltransferase
MFSLCLRGNCRSPFAFELLGQFLAGAFSDHVTPFDFALARPSLYIAGPFQRGRAPLAETSAKSPPSNRARSCRGHVGLIPARATWTGGFKAVGRTAAEALSVYEHVKALEAAGAVGAEIEVVPARVATEISKRTSLILMSMGAGSGCDAQYLFAEGVLGYTRGHKPRHAKVYRDFRTELDRLQDELIPAFKEFRATSNPAPIRSMVPIADAEFEAFVKGLGK